VLLHLKNSVQNCHVNDVIPAAEIGIYYKCTRFAVPSASVLRFLGCCTLSLACCVIDLVLSNFKEALHISGVCKEKCVENQWSNVGVILMMISLRCLK
jgi:hypothetical protein